MQSPKPTIITIKANKDSIDCANNEFLQQIRLRAFKLPKNPWNLREPNVLRFVALHYAQLIRHSNEYSIIIHEPVHITCFYINFHISTWGLSLNKTYGFIIEARFDETFYNFCWCCRQPIDCNPINNGSFLLFKIVVERSIEFDCSVAVLKANLIEKVWRL